MRAEELVEFSRVFMALSTNGTASMAQFQARGSSATRMHAKTWLQLRRDSFADARYGHDSQLAAQLRRQTLRR